jgi:hypothetical protein
LVRVARHIAKPVPVETARDGAPKAFIYKGVASPGWRGDDRNRCAVDVGRDGVVLLVLVRSLNGTPA